MQGRRRLWQQRRCEHVEVTIVRNSGLEVHVCEACGHVGIHLQEARPATAEEQRAETAERGR